MKWVLYFAAYLALVVLLARAMRGRAR